MAGDIPKPAQRGKGPSKPAMPTPPVAAAAPPVKPVVAAKPLKPVASKPAPKAKLPAPMLPEPVAAKAPEPAPTLAAPVIPAAVVPEITTAPKPVAAAPEPVAAPEPLVSTQQPPAPELSSAAISHKENTMEATIQDATTKTQALFGDANERAKAAFEKSTKMFEDMNAFGKGNIEAVVESSKIAAKGLESFGQEAADYTRKQFEGATAMMKSFASVKSPTELFKLQSDYFRQSFDSLVAESSKHTEAMLKLAGEVAQPLSNRVALAAEKAKIAA